MKDFLNSSNGMVYHIDSWSVFSHLDVQDLHHLPVCSWFLEQVDVLWCSVWVVPGDLLLLYSRSSEFCWIIFCQLDTVSLGGSNGCCPLDLQ